MTPSSADLLKFRVANACTCIWPIQKEFDLSAVFKGVRHLVTVLATLQVTPQFSAPILEGTPKSSNTLDECSEHSFSFAIWRNLQIDDQSAITIVCSMNDWMPVNQFKVSIKMPQRICEGTECYCVCDIFTQRDPAPDGSMHQRELSWNSNATASSFHYTVEKV